MLNSRDLNKYIEIYQDFLHPNPNINSQAIFLLIKDFREEFMNNLLDNLKEEDLVIRRKSILALGEYGEEILNLIVPLYINSKSKIVKVSCLKIMIKVVVKFNLKKLNDDVMLVINLAIKDSSPEITLSVISLLRQLGLNGRDILINTCRDKDLLRAKASISALSEMKDQTVDDLFHQLLNDNTIDPMIKEDILREKII
tara:strand:- start:470 stop:1066 length:597 start_codon:yes stop_codon:yes gene_type:complete